MGTDEYVRAYKAILRRNIKELVRAIAKPAAYSTLEEAEAFEDIRESCIRKGQRVDLAEAECSRSKGVAKTILQQISNKHGAKEAEDQRAELTESQDTAGKPIKAIIPQVL